MIKKICLRRQLTKHSLALLAMIIRTSLILPRGSHHTCASWAQPPGMYSTSILTRLSTIKSGMGMKAPRTCGGYIINTLMRNLYDRSSQIAKQVQPQASRRGRWKAQSRQPTMDLKVVTSLTTPTQSQTRPPPWHPPFLHWLQVSHQVPLRHRPQMHS